MKKKPIQEQLTVVLPENFSADKILDSLDLRKDLHANLKAGMFFILNSLVVMSQSRQWRDYFDKHGGYPLHSTILNQIVGKTYLKVIDLLEKNGVINRTDGYKTGKQAKLFALTKKYVSAGYKIRSIPKEAALYKRLLQHHIEEKALNEAALVKIKYITKWFDPQRLTLNRKRVNSLIEFYFSEMKALIPDPLPKGRTQEEIEARIALRVNSMIDTFNTISEGHMRLKKTGQDHRLHSVISNTKKELRGLYQYDGKPMVSVDIKASQPYLLNLLLKPKSWKKKGLISQVFPELHSKIPSSEYKKLLDTILMFGTFSKTHTGKGFQKTGFFRFQWDTDFYQHLVDLAKSEQEEKVFPDRPTVKKKMMMILFDDGLYMDQDKAFQLFSKWFPEEARIISLFKGLSREVKQNTPDGEGLSFLPILLQRLESFLILEKVCKKITKELPDAPIIPVHDCIMTTPEYSDKVAEITKVILEKETGLVPGIKIEQGLTKMRQRFIQELAAEDLSEILATKPKGMHVATPLKEVIRSKFDGDDSTWFVFIRGSNIRYYDPEGNNIHMELESGLL